MGDKRGVPRPTDSETSCRSANRPADSWQGNFTTPLPTFLFSVETSQFLDRKPHGGRCPGLLIRIPGCSSTLWDAYGPATLLLGPSEIARQQSTPELGCVNLGRFQSLWTSAPMNVDGGLRWAANEVYVTQQTL